MKSLIIWVVMEVFLNCVGLDDLADYSEFLESLKKIINSAKPKIVVVIISSPQKCPFMGIIK